MSKLLKSKAVGLPQTKKQ